MTIRIAMWSGPRNISTAMMRSFENRPDAAVIDEPFYAAYLAQTGLDHPMAAEVLANELRLDLYRIDLSSVVSKYIGETEKNLSRVFDAAEEGGAVLLFDEADALFGKRSEVKDSHDRYANIEVSYLLQRMESYRGLAILTTNQKGALDNAFLRRIRFIVQFPYPDAEQRAEILPPQAKPLDVVEEGGATSFGLDFGRGLPIVGRRAGGECGVAHGASSHRLKV